MIYRDGEFLCLIFTIRKISLCLVVWPLTDWCFEFTSWTGAGWIWCFGPLRVNYHPEGHSEP